jgi:hypothetical protein
MEIMTIYSFIKKYECQEIQIKNPCDSILSSSLVLKFWNFIYLFNKKDILTKDLKISYNKIKLIVKNIKWW